MMFPKYVWLFPLFAFICLLYSNDYSNDSKYDFVNKWLNVIKNAYFNAIKKSRLEPNVDLNQKVFTPNELKKYTNLKDGLYISILGQVFDVSEGAKHYEPGATYHGFTGRDASLAFISGEFNDKETNDDISSLSMQQVKVLNDWVQFYNKKYIYKGKLNGRYYNEDGTPTEESQYVQKLLIHAREEQFEEEHKERMFPPCNVEWSDSGTVVWCSKRSGGIKRDWIGVPRMLFESASSKKYRCACVNLDSKEYEEAKGMLREYLHCPKNAIECAVKIEHMEYFDTLLNN